MTTLQLLTGPTQVAEERALANLCGNLICTEGMARASTRATFRLDAASNCIRKAEDVVFCGSALPRDAHAS